MKKEQIEKDSPAAAKIRFWGELRDFGLTDSEKKRMLELFEKWFAESYDYDLAASRVLEKLVGIRPKSMSAFKSVYQSIGKKDTIGIRKFFGQVPDKEKLTRFIDNMFNEGKHENEITNAIILEAREQMGDRLDQVGVDKIRLWVLQEKVKLKIGEKNG